MNASGFHPLTTKILQELAGAKAFAFVEIYTMFISLGFIGRFLERIRQTFRTDEQQDADRSMNVSDTIICDPHLVAVIAAAAMAAMGRAVVLRRITFINSNTVSGWTEIGRASIHMSHNLRRNS